MKSIVIVMALLFCFAAPSTAADLNSVSGTYYSAKDKTQFLTLRSDGTFTLKQRKSPPEADNPFIEFSGRYQLNGEKITLLLEDGGGAEGQIQGPVFKDSQGDVWQKKAEGPQNVERPKYKRK